jgi:hypothetical protein
MEGKKEFYAKAENDIRSFLGSEGYDLYFTEDDLRGHSKPDGFAANSKTGNAVVVEIKSPKEPPETSSWRQIQPSDTEGFKRVRQEIVQKESTGELTKKVGGHIIIINGQLEYYKEIISNGKVKLPSNAPMISSMRTAYVMPQEHRNDVITALRTIGRKYRHYSGGSTDLFLID